MLCALFSLSESIRPLVLVPPMLGSQLHGNIKNLNSHWYCSKNVNDGWFWLNEEYFVPPITNCMAEFLSCSFDDATGKPVERPESDIYTIDFGGDKAIGYVDYGVFGDHFITVLNTLIETFTKKGYVIRKTLFGAPYDWRLSPIANDAYWPKLKDLIEQAYSINGNQKVALFGYSAGCQAIQYFLTKIVDSTWKSTYIDCSIMLAPSFPGSFEAFQALWEGFAVFLPGLFKSDSFAKMVTTIPTFQAHLHRLAIYGNDPIVFQGNNKYTANDLADLLLNNNKIPDQAKKTLAMAAQYNKSPLDDPNIPMYFVFNGGLDTPNQAKFDNGFSGKMTVINGKGDGTIERKGSYWACSNWGKGGKPLVCHDVDKNDKNYGHTKISHQSDVLDLIYNAVNSDSWKLSGRHNLTGTSNAGWKNMKAQ